MIYSREGQLTWSCETSYMTPVAVKENISKSLHQSMHALIQAPDYKEIVFPNIIKCRSISILLIVL